MIKRLTFISLILILGCTKGELPESTYTGNEGWIRFTKIKDIDNDGILELYNTSNPYSDQNNYLEWEIISSQLLKVN